MAVINGTANADTLTGTADADVISGFAGNDVINGLGGNDTIQGGDGADTMDGGTGADLLIGGLGNDVYIVDQQGDQVIEDTGANTGDDLVQTTVSYILAGAQSIESLQAIGSDAINLTGNELSQTLIGNTAANVLDGGLNTTGGDVLQGGLGNDTYLVRNATDSVLEQAGQGSDTAFVAPTAGNYALAAGQEVEVLSVADQSSNYAVNLTGNEFAQTIIGNGGVNILTDGGFGVSGAAADILIGLGGNDIYNVTIAGTQVIEAANGGADQVNTLVSFNAGSQSIEQIIAQSAAGVVATGNLALTGGAGDQTITGGSGNDTIIGGGGNDVLSGGAGNDTYVVDGGDTIADSAGALDAVITSAPITLATGVGIEQLFATGSARFTQAGVRVAGFGITSYAFDTVDGTRNLNAENTSTSSVAFLNGNETAQLIVGNASDNILDGNRNANLTSGSNTGAGFSDTLSGLAGNDIYRVYAQDDVVLEDRNGGRDTVFTSASYSLATNDTNANVVLGGTNDDPATVPNEFVANAFYSVAEIEVLSTANNSATDAIDLGGNAFGNIIVGNFGANVITGGGTSAGGGTDVLIGLAGNDTYVVDSINTVVFEDANNFAPDGTAVAGGIDTVQVSQSASGFTLNAGTRVEFMTTSSTTGIAMVGNELAQSITGGTGADTLSGGGGNDTLAGGAGNDTYRVADTNVVITEAANAGTDSVFTVGISYQLAGGTGTTNANGPLSVEYLSTTAQGSTEAITLTGNNLAQVIVGNYGDNTLDSGQGAITGTGIYNQSAGGAGIGDTLIGLFGNDTYRVYSQSDVVTEAAGQGTDVISTSADYSLAANNTATANGGNLQSIEVLRVDSSVAGGTAVTLTGDSQANTLVGHAGQNTLDGGLGNDTLTGGQGADSFQFSTTLGSGNVDTITDFQAGDLIRVARSVFATTAGSGIAGGITADNFVVGTAAADNNDYFIYNQTTGQLFFDADGSGSGSAILFAQLTAGTALGFNSLIAY